MLKTGILGAGLGLALLMVSGGAEAVVKKPAKAEAGNAVAGEKVFARCAACHKVGPDAKSGFGPALNGVVGHKAASLAGYTYSPAMKGAGLTWNTATLERYLTAPAKLVPGTKMAFPGVPEAKDRADVIAYLRQFDAQGHKK